MNIPDMIAAAEQDDVDCVIDRDGTPAAVIVGYGRYESLLETLDVLAAEQNKETGR